MQTPIHSINIDFTHSSEAKLLHRSVLYHACLSRSPEEREFLNAIVKQLESDIELLESLEDNA